VMEEHRARRRAESGAEHIPAVASVLPAAAGWFRQFGSLLASPIREVQTLTSPQTLKDHPLWTDPPLDASGLPVLLIGGLACAPDQLQTLKEWLSRLNCRASIAATGYGMDCGERSTAMVTDSLSTLAAATGQRCVLIAHSRGGQFARAVAVRHPELVKGLVVMGSPINRLLGVHPILKAEVAILGLAGTLGMPGLFRSTCLWGQCCRRLRADMLAPFPEDVSFLSVYSRLDHMVNWRSCLDPAASHREVQTTHSGLLCSADAFQVLADELGRILAGRSSVGASLHALPAAKVRSPLAAT
jgi:triacylglycerol lipase